MIINLGDAPFKAFIKVTYYKGTCTVKGNGQTYTHSGGGTVTFTVKKKGTYTISAEYNSIAKASTTVSITARGETVSKTLSYTAYAYNSGDVSSVSGGWTYTESKQYTPSYVEYSSTSFSVGSTLSYSSGRDYNVEGTDTLPRKGWVYSKKKIDMTPFKKLTIKSSGGGTLSIASSTTSGAVKSVVLGSGTYTIDLSSVNSSYYISIYNDCSGDSHDNIKITQLQFTS